MKKSMPRHIIIEVPKSGAKEKILKVVGLGVAEKTCHKQRNKDKGGVIFFIRSNVNEKIEEQHL